MGRFAKPQVYLRTERIVVVERQDDARLGVSVFNRHNPNRQTFQIVKVDNVERADLVDKVEELSLGGRIVQLSRAPEGMMRRCHGC